jgi:hypothetical protein
MPAKRFKSEGKCVFCKKMLSQKDIEKHLAMHLAEMEKADADKKPKTYYHIVVEADVMFLHLLVKGSNTMKTIDNFLRDIWLDCCDHLSGFGHKNFKVSMKHLVKDVFEPQIKIYHDYDYGSTTRIFLKGLMQYQLSIKQDIMLLSRNEPINFICSTCKQKPAVNICTTCSYDMYAMFCESCSSKHEEDCEDFADYGCMPVVNSPRMGVCGYTGGRIDLDRDGVYIMSK